MNLIFEITNILNPSLGKDFTLANSPVSFENKNGLLHIKICLLYHYEETVIKYAYNGYVYDNGEIKSRDCFSTRHQEVSSRITKALNEGKMGHRIANEIV